jgi:hypothetical protein
MINRPRAFLLLLALMFTAPAGAEPLDAKTPVRGWTILSNSEPDALAVIGAAKAYNINHLELSHEIVMDLREIRDQKNQAFVHWGLLIDNCQLIVNSLVIGTEHRADGLSQNVFVLTLSCGRL